MKRSRSHARSRRDPPHRSPSTTTAAVPDRAADAQRGPAILAPRLERAAVGTAWWGTTRRRSRLAMMVTAAVWCSTASSPASAAVRSISGCSSRTSFLHSWLPGRHLAAAPKAARKGASAALSTAPVVARSSGSMRLAAPTSATRTRYDSAASLSGASRHRHRRQHAVGLAGGTLPRYSVSATGDSMLRCGITSSCSSSGSSSSSSSSSSSRALGMVVARGGSSATFASGSGSRTAARKRRDRRRATRASSNNNRPSSGRSLRSHRNEEAEGEEKQKRGGGAAEWTEPWRDGAASLASEELRRPRAVAGGEGATDDETARTREQQREERWENNNTNNGNGKKQQQQQQQQQQQPQQSERGGGSNTAAAAARPPPEEGISLPFGTAYHVPVVCEEVLEWLITKPEGVYVDCTLGGGGHSAALLSALGAGARVIGLDRDPDALREASARLAAEAKAGRFQAVRSNFADVGRAVRECELLLQQPPLAPEAELPASPPPQAAVEQERKGSAAAAAAAAAVSPSSRASSNPTAAAAAAAAAGVPPRTTSAAPLVDGILVDLGVSSHQIDDGARGFSFSADGPLDMRMEGTGDGDSVGERSVASTSREHEDRAVEKGGREGGGGGGDGRGGGGGMSAADVVNFADESEIREMVWRYGDEKR
ncbi:unnamed protein product, partial [Ectocarpus sp. 4 AP-2014]